MSELLSLAQVAREIHRSPEFVRGLVDDGVLPCIRHRGRRYVTRADLEAFLSLEQLPDAARLTFPMAAGANPRLRGA